MYTMQFENVFRFVYLFSFSSFYLFLMLSSNFNFFGWCDREMAVNGMCIEESRPVSRVCNAQRYKTSKQPETGRERVCVTYAILIVHVCLYLKYYWINCLTRSETKNKRNGVWTLNGKNFFIFPFVPFGFKYRAAIGYNTVTNIMP